MPTQVHTNCKITGPKEDRDALVTLMIREDDFPHPSFNFNRIIPMPAELVDMWPGSRLHTLTVGLAILACEGDETASDAFEALARRLRARRVDPLPDIYHWDFNDWSTAKEMIEEARRVLLTREATGYTGPFEWSIEHWGTDQECGMVHDLSKDSEVLSFLLINSYSFPEPTFKALAHRFPNLEIDCHWGASDYPYCNFFDASGRWSSKRLRRRPKPHIPKDRARNMGSGSSEEV